jgi:hypothetical protein
LRLQQAWARDADRFLLQLGDDDGYGLTDDADCDIPAGEQGTAPQFQEIDLRDIRDEIITWARERGMDAGHAFPVLPFFRQRADRYSPPERDAVEPTLKALVVEGVFEQRSGQFHLTEKGMDIIYPDGMAGASDFVRNEILALLVKSGCRAGSALPTRPLATQASTYNPLQKRALAPVLTALVQDGTLTESNGNYVLTQDGYERIYA